MLVQCNRKIGQCEIAFSSTYTCLNAKSHVYSNDNTEKKTKNKKQNKWRRRLQFLRVIFDLNVKPPVTKYDSRYKINTTLRKMLPSREITLFYNFTEVKHNKNLIVSISE